jgi:transposase
MPRAAALPNDVESLQALLRTAHGALEALSAQLRSRDVLIEHLKLQLARLKRMKFGRSSEQLDAQIAQLEFSLEELEGNAAAAMPLTPAAPAGAPPARPARKPFPEHLRREPQVHEPATGACHCPQCGGTLRALGEDVAEMLEFVPEHWKVIKHVRPKYSCSACQKIVQANAPSRPIERSYAGPGLLAHVLVAKYCDHLPFYRQSQIYARDGVEIERCIDVDTDTGRIEAFVMDADGKPKLNEAGDAIERRVWIDQGVRIVWS